MKTKEEVKKSILKILQANTDPGETFVPFYKFYPVAEAIYKLVESQQDQWIAASKKPKFTEEYMCAIDLQDGEEGLICGPAHYDAVKDQWTDIKTGSARKVVYYQLHPKVPTL